MGKLRDATFLLRGDRKSARVGNALIMSTVLAYAASGLLCTPVLADVSLDGSWTDGVIQPLIGPNFQILETDGLLVGNNLFHSFFDFSLLSGESATFFASFEISNVLSRVTGGNMSTIDGAIISTIPGANFFFMNPNGVLFGPNASIDVGGAFTVTTANQLELADGGIFAAQREATSILTSADVASFGFLGSPASVSFEGSQLNTTAGSSFGSFNVIAGDVTLNNAAISTPAGNVSIVSVGSVSDESVGRVHLNATDPAGPVSDSDFTAMGDVSVADSTIETGAFGVASSDRRVLIRGGRLMFERSQVQSYGVGAIHLQSSSDFAMNHSNIGSELGAIDVDAGNDFTMINGSNIAGGGAIHIDAGNDFTMIGDNEVPNAINSFGGEVIRVEAGETITITDATIVSNATASENGGDIQIYGKNLIIGRDDPSQPTRSGAIYSLTEGDTEYRSGDITIYMTENIVLNTDAGIVGNTTSRGSGANVNVEAGGNLILVAGAISSLTAGPGNGGNVRVETGGDAEIGGGIAVGSTQQQLHGVEESAGGSPGSITLDIGNDLTLTGSIGAIDDAHGYPINPPSPDAGLIDIRAGGKITINGGSSISVLTTWTRNAGGIMISAADTIVVDGRVSAETTGSRDLYANRMSEGLIIELRETFGLDLVIGEVAVTLRIEDADGNFQELNVQERIRSDGLVELVSNGMVLTGNVGELLFLENNGGLQTTTGSDVPQDQRLRSGNGGEITLNAGNRIDIGGIISTATAGAGNAGGVALNASDISVSGSVSSESTGTSSDLIPAGRAGTVFFSGPAPDDLFDAARSITISGAVTTSTVDGGAETGEAGSISFIAGSLQISEGGSVTASTTGMGKAGSIDVTATNTIDVSGQGATVSTQSEAEATGAAGSISLNADQITISDGAEVTTATVNGGAGTGETGSISIIAGSLQISEGGSVTASTSGMGKAGSIDVTATNTIDVSGQGATVSTQSEAEATGAAGSISLNADRITISDGGEVTTATVNGGAGTDETGSISIIAGSLQISEGGSVTASTSGMGKAGSIDVTATNTIDVSGQGATVSTQSEAEATGAAGSISLNADRITISDGGEVTTATVNGGAGTDETGSISIIAGSLQISEGGSVTASTTGMGTGGDIELDVTGTVSVLDGANISSTTAETGDGGNVRLSAQNILIDGLGEISAASTATENGGKGGSVQLASIDGLTVSNGGKISVSSISSDGGDIDIAVDGAGSIDLSGESMITANAGGAGGNVLVELAGGDLILDTNSEITANAEGGTGGDLILSMGGGEVLLNDASSFEANSENGDGGNITVNDAGELRLSGGSAIMADAGGDGGNVFITALAGGDLILDTNSAITADAGRDGGEVNLTLRNKGLLRLNAGSSITANAQGDGGNLNVTNIRGDGSGVILDHSSITANAVDGTGGIVNIATDFLLRNESTIEAKSDNGAAGEVNVNVVFDLGNTEARLSDEVVDEQEVAQGLDPSKVADDHSTFVPGGGRGGIPVDPAGYMPSLQIWDLPLGEPQPLER